MEQSEQNEDDVLEISRLNDFAKSIECELDPLLSGQTFNMQVELDEEECINFSRLSDLAKSIEVELDPILAEQLDSTDSSDLKPVASTTMNAATSSDPCLPENLTIMDCFVPDNASPGSTFQVEKNGRVYEVITPQGSSPGQMVSISIMAPTNINEMFPEEHKQFIDMGFEPAESSNALNLTNGNMQLAMVILLNIDAFRTVVGMGFNPIKSAEALDITNGDVDRAISRLQSQERSHVLEELGFDMVSIQSALSQANGDIDAAAAILLAIRLDASTTSKPAKSAENTGTSRASGAIVKSNGGSSTSTSLFGSVKSFFGLAEVTQPTKTASSVPGPTIAETARAKMKEFNDQLSARAAAALSASKAKVQQIDETHQISAASSKLKSKVIAYAREIDTRYAVSATASDLAVKGKAVAADLAEKSKNVVSSALDKAATIDDDLGVTETAAEYLSAGVETIEKRFSWLKATPSESAGTEDGGGSTAEPEGGWKEIDMENVYSSGGSGSGGSEKSLHHSNPIAGTSLVARRGSRIDTSEAAAEAAAGASVDELYGGGQVIRNPAAVVKGAAKTKTGSGDRVGRELGAASGSAGEGLDGSSRNIGEEGGGKPKPESPSSRAQWSMLDDDPDQAIRLSQDTNHSSGDGDGDGGFDSGFIDGSAGTDDLEEFSFEESEHNPMMIFGAREHKLQQVQQQQQQQAEAEQQEQHQQQEQDEYMDFLGGPNPLAVSRLGTLKSSGSPGSTRRPELAGRPDDSGGSGGPGGPGEAAGPEAPGGQPTANPIVSFFTSAFASADPATSHSTAASSDGVKGSDSTSTKSTASTASATASGGADRPAGVDATSVVRRGSFKPVPGFGGSKSVRRGSGGTGIGTGGEIRPTSPETSNRVADQSEGTDGVESGGSARSTGSMGSAGSERSLTDFAGNKSESTKRAGQKGDCELGGMVLFKESDSFALTSVESTTGMLATSKAFSGSGSGNESGNGSGSGSGKELTVESEAAVAIKASSSVEAPAAAVAVAARRGSFKPVPGFSLKNTGRRGSGNGVGSNSGSSSRNSISSSSSGGDDGAGSSSSAGGKNLIESGTEVTMIEPTESGVVGETSEPAATSEQSKDEHL